MNVSTRKPKVVFDTQLLLRAAINPFSLPAKLLFDWQAYYELVSSSATLEEAIDVLNRASLRAKFPKMTTEVIENILELLRRASQSIITSIPAISRDPKDDIFLACAVVNRADYLVSEDKDLLVLSSYQGVQIMNALDFLRVLQSLANDGIER